jgi:hypothetical protein
MAADAVHTRSEDLLDMLFLHIPSAISITMESKRVSNEPGRHPPPLAPYCSIHLQLPRRLQFLAARVS